MKSGYVLSGNRINVRDYVKTDLSFCIGLWLDPENGKYMSDPTAEYVDDVYRIALNGLEDSLHGYYFIVQSKATGEPLGTCCAFPNEDASVYDIGYCISKKYWNQGYGTEAVNLLIDWIRSLGAQKITAEVAAENTASKALLTKFGFEGAKETEFQKYNMDIKFKSYIYQLLLDQ